MSEVDFVCPDCNEWVEGCTCEAGPTAPKRSRRVEIEQNSAQVVGELFDRLFQKL